ETKLVSLWEEVLRVYRIGVTDRFLHLGGQSLHAVAVASRIVAEFGVRLPLSALLSNPDIRELVELIHGSKRSDSFVSIPKAKELLFSPAQQRLWFLDQFIPNRSAYNISLARRIQGPLDLDILRSALLLLLQRHSVLRSSVDSEGNLSLLAFSDYSHIEIE